MEEELRDMKAHKAYYNMLHFVSHAQQGIPKLCPCGSITKEFVDEEDTYDYLPGKIYFICKDYQVRNVLQPWVMGVHQEIERLKQRFHEQEKLLRKCEALKVKMLLERVCELERVRGGAWLNTSKDPIVSNEQKAGAFWKRIVEYYNSSPLLVGTIPRELGQCKQRWARINDLVCKFAGCYDMGLREQRSGQNDNDVMMSALDIFHNDQNQKFNLEHTWRELRHDVKRCSTYLEKEKRKPVDPVDGGGAVPEPEERPVGVKAAKAAKKRKKTGKEEKLAKLENLLEIKKQISKQSLLESLLAKSEPLSEMESALKMKLMSELL
uniref:Myb-like domain-containing protein n=1 Tax=Brassica oleracea var. oleracea TaxID=109376 RepID=A0A0D3BVZ1_BRAOL